MKLKGYSRIKKINVKGWLLGGNSKIYAVILILFLAAVLFVFKSVTAMNVDNDTEQTQGYTEEQTQEQSSIYVAENQKYLIKVNKSKNFMKIYTMDNNMEFTEVWNSFWCSVNNSVDVGRTFISDKSVWYKIKDSAYGHYANRLDSGAWIYSVPYYSQDISRLNINLYNNLGKATKTGSIYIEAGNAKWIYENCGNQTVVEVYEDMAEPIPDGLLQMETLPNGSSYDPSDMPKSSDGACPAPINYMRVVKGKVITVGSAFDPMEGASAFDMNGNDISSYIKVEGNVDTTKEGVYPLTYSILDIYGKSLSYYREVTVTSQ
ncbi:MAG: DUF5011 domain-containing protein [Eubacteriales bacterium]|nr:DUF5011 domain-containing protein [Eubacteriales bacterium]